MSDYLIGIFISSSVQIVLCSLFVLFKEQKWVSWKEKEKKLHEKMLLKEIKRVVEKSGWLHKSIVISSSFNSYEVEELVPSVHFYHVLLFR